MPFFAVCKQALKWLEAASEQGNPFADYALGKLYADGEVTAKDMEKAFHHLHKAADADNAYAQYRLGRLYLLDLRNPTRSDGDNMLHLVNKYMDEYLTDHNNLSAKAKAEKYAKITA